MNPRVNTRGEASDDGQAAERGGPSADVASAGKADAVQWLAGRLAEVEAKCVAHGIVLQAIVGLLPEGTVQELKAAATSVDDEGMQEANPDPQLRRIAAQIRHLLQLL